MKRVVCVIFLISVWSVSSATPAEVQTRSNPQAQARQERKAVKKQQQAQKKYAKAQKKAQRKMEKYDRKHTHDPNMPKR